MIDVKDGNNTVYVGSLVDKKCFGFPSFFMRCVYMTVSLVGSLRVVVLMLSLCLFPGSTNSLRM